MYLEIDEGYFEHAKTLRLCAALKDHHAAIYPIRLWKWACRSAKDGNLGHVDAFVVEKVVGYEPMDGKCFAAMCSPASEHRSFLDVNEDGTITIHDWMAFTGAAVKRMEDSANEKKLFRAHKAGKCDRQSCKWCNDVRKMYNGPSTDSPQTVNRTSGTVQSSHATSSPATDPNENSPARDPCSNTTEYVARQPPKRPTGNDLCQMFGRLRREILQLQCPPGVEVPPDANGKAASFAERMDPQAFADVEPTMRAFLLHLKRGDKDWNADPNNASLSFGAWRDRFGDLRSELAGGGAKVERQPARPMAKGEATRWATPRVD